jgi:16S rRNA (uracil1498-N3)-methyltransferase
MSERFYTNSPLQPGPVEVTGPEAHHLAVVCRLGAGDQVCLFNGDGHEYPARVQSASKRSVLLEVLAKTQLSRELSFTLTVAAPLPRGDRAQFLVEKLTEIGVTAFVPLSTERSVVHPRDAKLEKLHRHVIEASKQCGRNVLMKVANLTSWADYCQQEKPGETKLLAHPGYSRELPLPPEKPGTVTIVVGPEGGFTDQEIELAQRHGWRRVGLGPRILRVETAALVLAARISAIGERPDAAT